MEKQSVITHFIQSLDFYFENPNLVTDDLLKLKIKELILLLLQTDNAENIITLFSHLFNPRQAGLFESSGITFILNNFYSRFSPFDRAEPVNI